MSADDREGLLRSGYDAFNARDVDRALDRMHPEVDWPNAWEGGRARGHEGEAEVTHVYAFRDGLIVAMDVEDGE